MTGYEKIDTGTYFKYIKSNSSRMWRHGILQQHYTASESRRLRLETSPPWSLNTCISSMSTDVL